MKRDGEANEQFDELATALREIGAGWVVDDVQYVVARGKTVLLKALPEEQLAVYRERLETEDAKGLPVGRIGKADEATVPYAPSERLRMLVDAADRVIATTVRAHEYVANFATENDLLEVRFATPGSLNGVVDPRANRRIDLQVPAGSEQRILAVQTLLETEVVE